MGNCVALENNVKIIEDTDLKYLCEENPTCLFEIDTSGDMIYLNKAWTKITGYNVAESLGKQWLNTVHPDDVERVAAKYFNHVNNKRDEYLEYRIICKNSSDVKWIYAVSNYKDEKHGHIGYLEDITKRKNIVSEILNIKMHAVSIS